jgi:ribosome-associated protein
VEEEQLEPESLAREVVDLAVDKLSEDVLLLDIQPVSTIADYFVVCSGASDRQVEAIHEHVVSTLKKKGTRPLHTEGDGASGWVLIDYGAVIVHIFLPELREYYALEQLWKAANTVVRIM